MSLGAVLTIIHDGKTLGEHQVSGELMMGRSSDCKIQLDDRAVSRHHAFLRPIEGGLQVERKSDFALLSVNGANVSAATLKEGDILTVGPYLIKVSLPKEKVQIKGIREESTASATLLGGTTSMPLSALPEEPVESSKEEGTATRPLEKTQEAESPVADAGGEFHLEDLESSIPLEMENETPQENEDKPEGNQSPDFQVDLEALSNGDEGSAELDFEESQTAQYDGDEETKVETPTKIIARLIFSEGEANHKEFDIEKEEILIGRSRNCDIILSDKKSSRRSAIIKRVGNEYRIKDLKSSNGTYVNGLRVDEKTLQPEDQIQVGNAKFFFKVSQANFAEKEKKFLEVSDESEEKTNLIPDVDQFDSPQDPSSPPPLSPEEVIEAGISQQKTTESNKSFQKAAEIPGIAADPAPAKRTLMEKFREQPPARQVLIALLVFVLFWFLMMDGEYSIIPLDQPSKQKKVAKKDSKQRKPSSTKFKKLNQKQKDFVRTQHQLGFELYKNKEYDKALFEIRKIFQLVDDYKDAREIERYSIEGKQRVESLQEEQKRREEEARLKAKVETLVSEAQVLMDKKVYKNAKQIFPEILAIDPENEKVAQWQELIKQIEAEEEIRRKEREVARALNEEAKTVYQKGVALQKKGKFISAIRQYARVFDVGASDRKIVQKAKRGIRESEEAVQSIVNPLMDEAKQLESSGSFSGAYQVYRKIIRIDPRMKEASSAMTRIRSTLKEQSRILYTEAVLAESYSDFATAKGKFEQILKLSPEDGVYYKRAKRKLGRYPAFVQGGEEF